MTAGKRLYLAESTVVDSSTDGEPLLGNDAQLTSMLDEAQFFLLAPA